MMRARNLLAWLPLRRRQPSGTERVLTDAERAAQVADDEAVTAALRARTLRRGRMRIEDDPTEMAQRTAPQRGSR